jgi:hypothetical protein
MTGIAGVRVLVRVLVCLWSKGQGAGKAGAAWVRPAGCRCHAMTRTCIFTLLVISFRSYRYLLAYAPVVFFDCPPWSIYSTVWQNWGTTRPPCKLLAS